MIKYVNGGNYYNDDSFKKMCLELERGNIVKIYIEAFGRGTTEREFYNYYDALVEHYGDNLEITKNNIYHTHFKLKTQL